MRRKQTDIDKMSDKDLLNLLSTVVAETRSRIYPDGDSGHWNDCYVLSDLERHVREAPRRKAAEQRNRDIDEAWLWWQERD